MLVVEAYPSQSVLAFSYNVLDADSRLALPASAKAKRDAGSDMCIIEGSLALSTQDLLTVGQGVTLLIDGNRDPRPLLQFHRACR